VVLFFLVRLQSQEKLSIFGKLFLDKPQYCKMREVYSNLGRYLKNLRKQRDETLHQVSVGTDIDSPLLSKIERGRRLPTPDQLQRLAKFFKLSPTDLRIKYTAEKILKQYGASDTTYAAIQLVNEQLVPYLRKTKEK
jgi:transcriptional regulator with XRE-family HTH domain